MLEKHNEIDSLLVQGVYTGIKLTLVDKPSLRIRPGPLYLMKTYNPTTFFKQQLSDEEFSESVKHFFSHDLNRGPYPFTLYTQKEPIGHFSFQALAPITNDFMKLLLGFATKEQTYDFSQERIFKEKPYLTNYFVDRQKRFKRTMKSVSAFSFDDDTSLENSVREYLNCQYAHVTRDSFDDWYLFHKKMQELSGEKSIFSHIIHYLRTLRSSLKPIADEYVQASTELINASIHSEPVIQESYKMRLSRLAASQRSY